MFPELLSPAGDLERLKAAVCFGADAVYLGSTEFGMRAASATFDLPTLKEGIEYAHQRGVKVYLTCNTLPRNDEILRMPEFLKDTFRLGVDAYIVTDLGVLFLIKKHIPDAEIHLSTQAGIVNFLSATEAYHMGAKRVVLARELSLEEIRFIREHTPPELEIETFVHGAMCMSVSGRCLISNYMVNRDANRGECAQPCRWAYHLMEEKRPGDFYPVFEDENGSYILNAKDLCMIEYLDQLMQAGITSFKIEGRAKSSFYVSVVTNAYRIALDALKEDPAHFSLPSWLLDEVRKVSHRDYSTGFYFDTPTQRYENGGYIRNCDVIGIVEGFDGEYLTVTQKNKFSQGEEAQLLEPGQKPVSFLISSLLDGEGTPILSAPHPHMTVKIPFSRPVAPGSILRKEIG